MINNINIPIIIVHKGDSFYLCPILKQLRLFNPDGKIYLIGDNSTKKYDFITHVNIDDYMNKARLFESKYIHLSSNPYDYELICFLRWFIVFEFSEKNAINDFLCLDSDVLIFCNVNEIFPSYLGCDFTICEKAGPGCSMFNLNSLKNFCDYIEELYDDNSKQTLIDFYQSFVENKQPGGVCDMTIFEWYQRDMNINVIDVTIAINGSCFDGCITTSSGFEMKNGIKKVYWQNDLPYGKRVADGSLVRFLCLHFQGRTKYKLFNYLLDENKKHQKGLIYNLSWMLSYPVLRARINGIKKIFKNPKMLYWFIRRKFSRK